MTNEEKTLALREEVLKKLEILDDPEHRRMTDEEFVIWYNREFHNDIYRFKLQPMEESELDHKYKVNVIEDYGYVMIEFYFLRDAKGQIFHTEHYCTCFPNPEPTKINFGGFEYTKVEGFKAGCPWEYDENQKPEEPNDWLVATLPLWKMWMNNFTGYIVIQARCKFVHNDVMIEDGDCFMRYI